MKSVVFILFFLIFTVVVATNFHWIVGECRKLRTPDVSVTDYYRKKVRELSLIEVSQADIVLLGDSLLSQLAIDNFSNCSITNLAISGETSSLLKKRIQSYSFSPSSKVVLMVGVNDIGRNEAVDTVFGNITDIVDYLKLSVQEIILYQVILTDGFIRDNSKIKVLNDRLAELEAPQIRVLDTNLLFRKELRRHVELWTDGLHLTADSYKIIEESILSYCDK